MERRKIKCQDPRKRFPACLEVFLLKGILGFNITVGSDLLIRRGLINHDCCLNLMNRIVKTSLLINYIVFKLVS